VCHRTACGVLHTAINASAPWQEKSIRATPWESGFFKACQAWPGLFKKNINRAAGEFQPFPINSNQFQSLFKKYYCE